MNLTIFGLGQIKLAIFQFLSVISWFSGRYRRLKYNAAKQQTLHYSDTAEKELCSKDFPHARRLRDAEASEKKQIKISFLAKLYVKKEKRLAIYPMGVYNMGESNRN